VADRDRASRRTAGAPREVWLKAKRRPSRASKTPWKPPSLPDGASIAGLSYVVVEERVDKVVGLIIAPWPRVSSKGHLEFPREPPQLEAGVDVDELQAVLDREREPPAQRPGGAARELRTRDVTLGDVFAAQVELDALDDPATAPSPGVWLGPAIYDVTPDAREAARTVFFDAVSDPLPKRVEAKLKRELRKRDD
jgi:hypothetical protein